MKLYQLHRTQCLPISIGAAWAYFSNPKNLPQITPPRLRLEVTSMLPDKMYPGILITYRVKPILGIAWTWVTEITHVVEPYFFTDEQRFGPYRFWHHQHLFREIDGGVEMQDIVHYALRFEPLARLVAERAVGKQLQDIFDFRQHVLEQLFGTMPQHDIKTANTTGFSS
jgi:ligand-binding SRPBCC domain-containing protein